MQNEKIKELMERGVQEIYPSEKFLLARLNSDKPQKVYLGIDPTGPTLHLGHIIQLFKLRQFQQLGHKVTLLIGDFTGMIGDPTDKKAVRKKLTREQVLINCKMYKEQASRILDFDGDNPAELKFNSDWLGKMSFADVVELASNFTVQQMLERDMFENRIKDGKPVYFHEFLYPLMQGYDSVALDTDGEIGGSDQIFNMLAGRTLQKALQEKEKFVLASKLLADTSGVKMGKTENNMIALTDSPRDIFGKIMSWTDGMILPGFELCTVVPFKDLKDIEKRLKDGENPKNLKAELAKEIIAFFFSKEEADQAAEEFERMFKDKGVPDDMPEVMIGGDVFTALNSEIVEESGMSGSEIRRLVKQGGVKVNGEKIDDINQEIKIEEETILQFGKRKFFKIIKK